MGREAVLRVPWGSMTGGFHEGCHEGGCEKEGAMKGGSVKRGGFL